MEAWRLGLAGLEPAGIVSQVMRPRISQGSPLHTYPRTTIAWVPLAFTLRTISSRAEGTFVRLRYILGGDRPSQTTRLALSTARIHGAVLETQYIKGGISRLTPRQPQPALQSLPPILSEMHRIPIPGCSKGARGLSV